MRLGRFWPGGLAALTDCLAAAFRNASLDRASGSWRLFGRWIGRERERVFEKGFNSCDPLAQVGHIVAQLAHLGA